MKVVTGGNNVISVDIYGCVDLGLVVFESC